MYKLKIITCIFLLAVCYSCSSDDDNNRFENKVVGVNVESSYKFKAGDAIGLFVEKRSERNTPSVPGNNNYKTNIKWIYQEDGSWSPAGSDDMIYTSDDGMPLDIYAYYPYTTQTGVNEISISSVSCIMTGRALNIDNDNIPAKLTLLSKNTLVKVIIPNIDILSSLQVTLKGVLCGGIIDPAKIGEDNDFRIADNSTDQAITFDNGCFIAYLPEQVFSENKLLVEIKEGDKTINYNLPAQIRIEEGKENIIPVNYQIDNLSDIPNTFMIKPGEDIYISVQKGYRMWQTNNLLSSTSPNLAGEVSSEVVWQENSNEVVEDLRIIGSGENALIHVKTKTGKEGNAVVAVKIGETIRWSWQLWVSGYDPLSKVNGATYNFNGLTFMDRNLGATGNPKTGGDRTFGLYYQWGRKDPFATRGNVETLEVTSEIKTNLANSIIYPNTYITSVSSPNDWYTKTGNLEIDRWINEQNTKTPFDPCPKGWRVPATGIDGESPWNNLVLPSDENKWGNGWHFDGTPLLGYYPAAGQRTATGGTTYAGSAGFYHTAKSKSTMRLDFTSVNFSFGGGKAAGRSVRCVKEY